VFQNLGDGTFHHSGSLAIRAAVAAGVNITYKILYNEAVGMTGGQAVDGPLTVPQLAHLLRDEGVARIALVSDAPERIAARELPAGATLHHRAELDRVQRELRELEGVSALVYVQPCATEKRRRRKRARLPPPAIRVFINPAVCENCGDCSDRSGCLAVVPIDTDLGRKRRIDQAACNQDLSCLQGFCPSFVTVHGATPRQRGAALAPLLAERIAQLPPPAAAGWAGGRSYDIVCAGVGGTGVVTLGALLAAAARLAGLSASVHDRVGMAQKFGAVTSHIRLAREGAPPGAVRIPLGRADLVLGCDLMAATQAEVLRAVGPGATRLIVNTDEAAPGAFVSDPDFDFRIGEQLALLREAAAPAAPEPVPATRLANALAGDTIGTNLFLLGYALQRGLLPLPLAALERAIEIHGIEAEGMRHALALGRLAAHDLPALRAAAEPVLLDHERTPPPQDLDALIERRCADLRVYQDARYARRYRELVERVRAREQAAVPGQEALATAAARGFYKVLAYKDEYEVARLLTAAEFQRQLALEFSGPYRLRFHLAPPLLARLRRRAGGDAKVAFRSWVLPLFRLLAGLRFLRGSPFDPFGYTADRRLDRRVIGEYEALVEQALARLTPTRHAAAVALLSWPERIRGFGPVKLRHYERAHEAAARMIEAMQQ
jgi:indolepyruvate ferredoxin oxidoreductase